MESQDLCRSPLVGLALCAACPSSLARAGARQNQLRWPGGVRETELKPSHRGRTLGAMPSGV